LSRKDARQEALSPRRLLKNFFLPGMVWKSFDAVTVVPDFPRQGAISSTSPKSIRRRCAREDSSEADSEDGAEGRLMTSIRVHAAILPRASPRKPRLEI
jgi:hypothetical protein